MGKPTGFIDYEEKTQGRRSLKRESNTIMNSIFPSRPKNSRDREPDAWTAAYRFASQD